MSWGIWASQTIHTGQNNGLVVSGTVERSPFFQMRRNQGNSLVIDRKEPTLR